MKIRKCKQAILVYAHTDAYVLDLQKNNTEPNGQQGGSYRVPDNSRRKV